jgi:hypothetical protein
VLLCLKTGTELTSEMSCFFKKLDSGQSKKKKNSVNFSQVVFSLLDFLTFEDRADGLSPNADNKLSTDTV